jgi:hypothetical protein
MGGIYSAHDIQAFRMTLVVRCGEPELTNSQLGYHAHQQLRSFCFACEADGKKHFNHIYL